MNKIIDPINSKEIQITGDGNCFFRSIIRGIIFNTNKEFQLALKLRKRIYQLLMNSKFVNKSIDGISIKEIIEISENMSIKTYANKILHEKYGGEIEAFIIAHYLHIRIVINFKNSNSNKYEHVIYDGNNGTNNITINLIGYFSTRESSNHYNLLVIKT